MHKIFKSKMLFSKNWFHPMISQKAISEIGSPPTDNCNRSTLQTTLELYCESPIWKSSSFQYCSHVERVLHFLWGDLKTRFSRICLVRGLKENSSCEVFSNQGICIHLSTVGMAWKLVEAYASTKTTSLLVALNREPLTPKFEIIAAETHHCNIRTMRYLRACSQEVC